MENSILVQQFIAEIWNNRSFEMLDNFLHPQFKDHSLLPKLSPDKEGLKKWIQATGNAFAHETTIEDQVREADQVMVRIRMNLRHVGAWRGIEPTGMEVYTTGYRQFRIQDDRIIEHWALIDGERIENQLREASHGCKVAH